MACGLSFSSSISLHFQNTTLLNISHLHKSNMVLLLYCTSSKRRQMPSQQHLSYQYVKVLCYQCDVQPTHHELYSAHKAKQKTSKSQTLKLLKNSVIVCKLNAVNCNALFSLLTHIFVWIADGHTCTGGK